MHVCIDPAVGVVQAMQVNCKDCLTYQVGALASLLPSGMSSQQLADGLSAHMRMLRGFQWSTSGYFTSGPGFWMTAAYFGDGLFLVDGSRNSSVQSDIDVLVRAFQLKIVHPAEPRMLDPALYTSEVVYVSFGRYPTPIQTKHDLLSSPHCSRTPRAGFRRASILEFQPLTSATAMHTTAVSGMRALATPARPLVMGDVCPICHAKVKERPLFSSTYIGCLC
ncbi:hypothetical protein [Pendulispora albinea]|uniref:Uncharacterized protein n=1 Tax=Pendulispora albinea TaxID=2741071 RepID=A0ABZ2LU31_9BACT